jgi:hypothetical protein
VPEASRLLAHTLTGRLLASAEAAPIATARTTKPASPTLTLSKNGQRTLTSAQALLREKLAELLEDLPRPEVDALARLLPFVEAALSGTAPPRRPPPPRPPHPPHPHR